MYLKNKKFPRKSSKRKTLEEMSFRELEKVLDRVFSEYIRLRSADENGYCHCITCGAIHHWKDIDCGHYLPRARQVTRYDVLNCFPQCHKCNRYRSGEHDLFRNELVRFYGKSVVEALEQKAMLGGGFDTYQLKQMIISYREEVKKIKLEKGL